ncbi:hypothetical protein H0H93_011629 [Arthromyces matolae]|nr:hypothetical protein H0H93_011629 [Arthromyces matolae]
MAQPFLHVVLTALGTSEFAGQPKTTKDYKSFSILNTLQTRFEPMADITKFEEHRAKLAASLVNVAEAMRTAAALADSFAEMVKDPAYTGTGEGENKSRKRKGAVEDGDEKATKRQRKIKDPNAPKRPASSYIMFQNDIRKDLKEKNPTLSNSDLLALISQKWADMTEEEKSVYTKANASAKEQYSHEKAAYDARSPEEKAAADAAALAVS